MNLIPHATAGLILSIILYPVFDNYVIILFISSFIFDIDHYIEYIIKNKKHSNKYLLSMCSIYFIL